MITDVETQVFLFFCKEERVMLQQAQAENGIEARHGTICSYLNKGFDVNFFILEEICYQMQEMFIYF